MGLCSFCCKCCILLVILMIILGISVPFIFKRVAKNHVPQVEVQSLATVIPFTLTSNSTTDKFYVTAGFNITLWAKNVNTNIQDQANVSVLYNGFVLSSSSFDLSCPGQYCESYDEKSRVVDVSVAVNSVLIDKFHAVALAFELARKDVSITIRIENWQGKFWRKTVLITVVCDFVKVAIPTGVMQGDPKRCEINLPSSKGK